MTVSSQVTAPCFKITRLEARCFTEQPICAAVHDEPALIQSGELGIYVELRSQDPAHSLIRQAYCQRCVQGWLERYFQTASHDPSGLTEIHVIDVLFQQTSENVPCWKDSRHVITKGGVAVVLVAMERVKNEVEIGFLQIPFCVICTLSFIAPSLAKFLSMTEGQVVVSGEMEVQRGYSPR